MFSSRWPWNYQILPAVTSKLFLWAAKWIVIPTSQVQLDQNHKLNTTFYTCQMNNIFLDAVVSLAPAPVSRLVRWSVGLILSDSHTSCLWTFLCNSRLCCQWVLQISLFVENNWQTYFCKDFFLLILKEIENLLKIHFSKHLLCVFHISKVHFSGLARCASQILSFVFIWFLGLTFGWGLGPNLFAVTLNQLPYPPRFCRLVIVMHPMKNWFSKNVWEKLHQPSVRLRIWAKWKEK